MPISVSIVEDSDKLRGTLSRVLSRAEGFACVSQYPNAEDALKDLPLVKPDVVLMDINLPGMNGVECVQKLKQILPGTQVMMLTVYEDTENIFNVCSPPGRTRYMLKRTSRQRAARGHPGGAARRFTHDHAHRAQGGAILPKNAAHPTRGKSLRPRRATSPRPPEPGTDVQGDRSTNSEIVATKPSTPISAAFTKNCEVRTRT